MLYADMQHKMQIKSNLRVNGAASDFQLLNGKVKKNGKIYTIWLAHPPTPTE